MAIVEMLRTLNERGKTTVLITHHLYLLPGFAERLVVMDAGKIALDGPLRDVLYDREGLERSGLIPPQTVRFAESFPSLRALRPLGPDDSPSSSPFRRNWPEWRLRTAELVRRLERSPGSICERGSRCCFWQAR